MATPTPFRVIYIAIVLMGFAIIYLNSFANEDKPRLARENRPYVILRTSEHLKDYDRLCRNGPGMDCYGETICKVARVECAENTTCDPLLPICSDRDVEDYQIRKFNVTSSR